MSQFKAMTTMFDFAERALEPVRPPSKIQGNATRQVDRSEKPNTLLEMFHDMQPEEKDSFLDSLGEALKSCSGCRLEAVWGYGRVRRLRRRVEALSAFYEDSGIELDDIADRLTLEAHGVQVRFGARLYDTLGEIENDVTYLEEELKG